MALGLRGVLRRDGQICKPRRGSSSFRGPDRVENFDHLNGAAGFRRFDNGEVAMIEVRRIGEGVPLDFEVVVREGEGVTRHHVTMSREMCERLTAGKHTPERCLEAAFRFLARPRAKGVDSRTLRRDGDLALLPRIRAAAAALPLAVLELCMRCVRDNSLDSAGYLELKRGAEEHLGR